MGMKSNSYHFKGTNGSKKIEFKLKMQLFANKKLPIKAEKLLKKVTDQKLINVIKELYRPGSNIGDGGTAAAIRYEIKNKELVGGKSHIIKGLERKKNLERFISRNDITKKDKRIAKKLYNELVKALGGYKK